MLGREGDSMSGVRRNEVAGLNGSVLTWARERAGSSVEDLATRLGKSPEQVLSWESGDSAPTYPELEHLAYDILKRPVAIFFFPDPPAESSPEESFRTLPGFEVEKLQAPTRLAIRKAKAAQLSLAEFFSDKNPCERPLLDSVNFRRNASVVDAAANTRQRLAVTIEKQTTTWRDQREAAAGWRDAIEAAGIFIFKEAIKQREVSGFCLYDPRFPVIVVNNSTSLTRQVFTLAHELGHLIARTGGVTKTDDEYLRALHGEPRDIEVFCNAFAAELLVPSRDFRERSRGHEPTDEFVRHLAAIYRVSREVILRRFLEAGRVSKAHYEKKAREWAADYLRVERGHAGGDFYRTLATYLSPTYLNAVIGRYLLGSIGAIEAGGLLGVQAKHLPGLEEVVLQKAGS